MDLSAKSGEERVRLRKETPMRQKFLRASLLGLAVAALGLAGCDSATDAVQQTVSSTQATQTIQSSAPSLAAAAPVADAAGDYLTLIMEKLGGSPLPMVAKGAVLPPAVTCPETIDLGNGITGTCSASDTGTLTFTFSGSTTIDG